MGTELVAKMVKFAIIGAAQYEINSSQIVRFYLDVPSPLGQIVRFNVNDAAAVYPTEGKFKNITFLYNNLFDVATVTTSSNHRKFPPSRLKHRWGTYHWRSWGDPAGDPKPDALASQWIKADLGSPKDVKAVLVWYHNFYNGATVNIQGDAGLDENIVLYSVNYPIVKLWDMTKTFQVWNLAIDGDWTNILTEGDFNEAVSYFDYARVGRVFIGDYFRPASNFNRSYVLGEEDDSQTFPTLEQQIVSNVVPRHKTIVYDFEDISESDYNEFVTMWEMVGTTTPFWIVQNAGRWYDQTYYVTFANQIGFKRKAGGAPKYDLQIVVEEVT